MIGIVHDSRFVNHLTGQDHPEQPARSRVIVEALKSAGLLTPQNSITPRYATVEELALCHDLSYIKKVKNECSNSNSLGQPHISTGDAPICPASYDIARLAAGGVLSAIDAVMNDKISRAFCIVRPPGHHATASQGMGFCLFNNVAIGAKYAQKVYGIKRVLIVDWDVHHGNGTQAILYNDKTVMYFSTHQFPLYPGTGAENEKGVGNVFNVPIAKGAHSRQDVLDAFENMLPNLAKGFKPELVIISAGFDGHERDPLGGFTLTDDDFSRLTKAVVKIADQYAHGKLVSVLEGGYDLKALQTASISHVKALK